MQKTETKIGRKGILLASIERDKALAEKVLGQLPVGIT